MSLGALASLLLYGGVCYFFGFLIGRWWFILVPPAPWILLILVQLVLLGYAPEGWEFSLLVSLVGSAGAVLGLLLHRGKQFRRRPDS